jgi:hypothetical protein
MLLFLTCTVMIAPEVLAQSATQSVSDAAVAAPVGDQAAMRTVTDRFAAQSVTDDPEAVTEIDPAEELGDSELEAFSNDDLCYDEPPATSPRCWIRGDYLLWWTKGNTIPALVTGSPLGTDRNDAGVIGLNSTEVLFGLEQIDNEDRSGGRVNFGLWIDPCQTTGVEATFFALADDTGTGNYAAQTDPSLGFGAGLPILARPFYNSQDDEEDAELVSFPDVVDGSIGVASSSELHSAAATLRRCYREGCNGRVDWLAGYRYFRFREGLLIGELLTVTDPGGLIAQNTEFDVFDSFKTENDFHGAEFGVSGELCRDVWTLEVLAKVAFGNIHRQTHVDGGTITRTPPPGVIETASLGGLLALDGTNIGTHTTDVFGVLPEFGVNLGIQLTHTIRLTAGYSLVMLNDVYRTGEMIDRTVNPTFIPGNGPTSGTPRPAPLPSETDFWAQGLNFGLVWKG